MRASAFALVLIAVASMSCTVWGQSFNVDTNSETAGPALGGGVPSSAYPAAGGQPGVWNSYPATSGPVSLVNLSGGATPVTLSITASSTLLATLAFNNPNNTGDFALLMNDSQQVGAVAPGGSRTFTFAGLVDGPYSVITYASPPPPGIAGETFIAIPGSVQGQLISSGAHTANTFALGVTHVMHTLNVVGGTFNINISDVPGAPAAWASGFQLTLVPEPSGLAAAIPFACRLVCRTKRA